MSLIFDGEFIHLWEGGGNGAGGCFTGTLSQNSCWRLGCVSLGGLLSHPYVEIKYSLCVYDQIEHFPSALSISLQFWEA